MAYFKNEYQFSNGHPQQIVVFVCHFSSELVRI